MRDAIRRFMTSGGDFEAVALALFQWQVEHNDAFRRFVGGIENARQITQWEQIPSVPVKLFRDLALTCFPPDTAHVTFHTSGTTGRPGIHRLQDTSLYDLGSRKHAEAVIGSIPANGISFVAHTAHSSLGHMCSHFVEHNQAFFSPTSGVDAEKAMAALQATSTPVFVPGTAFAFADLLSHSPAPISLPPGSIIMVTGGYKGRQMSIPEETLLPKLHDLFPATRLVGEYGMTELSSQLWSPNLGEPFIPPPWMRVMATDPWTGKPASEGVLRFIDLANHQTVLAVQTEDIGVVDNSGHVTLLGRLPNAMPRGCSLTAEPSLRAPSTSARSLLSSPPLSPNSSASTTTSAIKGAPNNRPIDSVLRAIHRLLQSTDAQLEKVGQGLSLPNTRACLQAACDAITADGLANELETPGARPQKTAIVTAYGVFTSPLEWVAMMVAAGSAVHLKAPSQDAAFCTLIADCFRAEGLPVTTSIERQLGIFDAVIAFGDDESVANIKRETPHARHALYGHRFSVCVVGSDSSLGQDVASAIARDHALYDTRGCMAPVAVFCMGNPIECAREIAQHMPEAQNRWPVGRVDPGWGGEWMRRRALARVEGTTFENTKWSVLELPAERFVPISLPRIVTVHGVRSPEEIQQTLQPWAGQLSSLGIDHFEWPSQNPEWHRLFDMFPRVCSIGTLQTPTFPRLHDGAPMLGSVTG